MAEEIKEVPTELDVIVQEINHLHQQEGIAAVAQPWLPPLKERITLDELDKVVPIEAWQKRTAPSVLIGVADIPQAQKQEAVAIDLSKDGNILLYGSPGTGKTTFLQTAAMDLARKQSPENLTMYLLDFGTNGLAPLTQLPHVLIVCCSIRRRKSRNSSGLSTASWIAARSSSLSMGSAPSPSTVK